MKKVTWICDTHGCQTTGTGMKPPSGWLEVSYWDFIQGKYIRFVFCGYECLGKWAEERAAEAKEVAGRDREIQGSKSY